MTERLVRGFVSMTALVLYVDPVMIGILCIAKAYPSFVVTRSREPHCLDAQRLGRYSARRLFIIICDLLLIPCS